MKLRETKAYAFMNTSPTSKMALLITSDRSGRQKKRVAVCTASGMIKVMTDAESTLLIGIQALIEREVNRRVRPLEETIKNSRGGSEVDEETSQAVREQVLIANKTWLTRKEAAKYLNVSERSIAEWAVRPQDQNPFPESSAGSEPRTRRDRIDEWADRERQKQRLKLAR
jgi:hypothetical protein